MIKNLVMDGFPLVELVVSREGMPLHSLHLDLCLVVGFLGVFGILGALGLLGLLGFSGLRVSRVSWVSQT